MSFWSKNAAEAGFKEPKRNFRFQVQIDAIKDDSTPGGLLWFAKTCDKPSFTIESTEHQYLNHTFYYPGALKWQTVSMQLVDPSNPDAAGALAQIIKNSKYAPPATAASTTTMSKGTAVSALGTVTIIQLDSDGNAIETLTLINAFITEVKFGSLEYGNDDLTTLDLTLQYDWAQCKLATGVNAPVQDGGNDFFTMA